MHTSLKHLKSNGFTIVELLIVIIVIGILATIGIIAYSGVQVKAIDKSLLSDVDGVGGEVTHYSVNHNGVYGSAVQWYSQSGANSNIIFTPTAGNIIDVNTSLTDYCIRIYNPNSSNKTLYTAITKESTAGSCIGISPSSAAVAANPMANNGAVTTLAGNSTSGYADGNGSAARFSYPYGIKIDSTGNIIVGDTVNNRIRKVTQAGDVTTIAGSGAYAFADGTGLSASFESIYGLTVDNNGTITATDSGNNAIRTITAAGVVTTLVGPTGPGVACQAGPPLLRSPDDIVADSNGNFYVSDSNNWCIRKVTSSGVVSIFAGGGSQGTTDANGTNAKFNTPNGMAIDSSGIIYVADTGNNSIRKISPSGDVTTLAGSSAGYKDGTGAAVQFSGPMDVAVDASGNVYVADKGNNKIRRITAAGVVTTVAGAGPGYADGTGTNALFNQPGGITVDGNGVIYVADTNNKRIRVIR